jgi:hypothetical protein
MTRQYRQQHAKGGGAGRGPSLARAFAGLPAVLIVLWLAHGLGTDWLRWKVTTAWNPAFLEGLAWWHGRFDLPYRLWDTAYIAQTSTIYNVFPPLQSIIGFLAVGLARLAGDASPYPEMRILPFLLFGLPLPVVGYWVFYRRTLRPLWAAVLTIGWLGGTAVLPCISEARNDGVHHINHLLSQIGLMLFADALLTRTAVWQALAGLLIAAWSRQLTAFYAVALLIAVLATSSERKLPRSPECKPCTRPERKRRVFSSNLVLTLIGLAVIAGTPMTLNWIKFQSPFRGGYESIYVDRDHQLARDARAHGLFSTKFIPRNAYYMNLALPWARDADGRLRWGPTEYGASMWLGTPLLLLALFGVRAWWTSPVACVTMFCSLPIIGALLMYHGTGQRQYGYWRFSLDFVPIWLVVAAPYLTTGWRRWPALACVAWSLAYFAVVERWSPLAA